MPAAPVPPGGGSFLRRNRSLLIILADIAILLVLGLVAYRFLGSPGGSARLGEYTLSLRALRYGEVVFATVTVERAGGARGRAEGAEERVFARFAWSRSASDAESHFDSAPAPPPEEEVLLQAALPLEAASERLYAEVRAGGESARLSLPSSAW